MYSKAPAANAHREVEQRSWIASGEEDREPGDDDCNDCGVPEHDENDVVGDCQQPLHQRQPAIEVSRGLKIVDLDMGR